MAEIISDLVEEEGSPIEDLEIQESVAPVDDVVEEIPEKFKGKSAKDIADSYINLEKEYGRKAQEIGELRKLTDQILAQQIAKPVQGKQEEPVVDDSDFFVDPQKAVERAIANHPKIKQYEEQAIQTQHKANMERFAAKHTDYQDVLKEDEFQQWVSSSPVRQRLFAQANSQYDFEAADEIFSQYKERKQLINGVKQQSKDNRDAALKASSVPAGNSNTESTKKTYRRTDLIRLKMTDPNRYEALSDEIMKAYAEGRVK